MFYITTTPFWLKWFFPSGLTWQGPERNQTIYLTFDDGPDPEVTNFVLDQLSLANMKGTFFCIGENVERYPETYSRILQDGHSVGNHTQKHVNGWALGTAKYMEDFIKASRVIDSRLFRPPYGKINRAQVKSFRKEFPETEIIMWSGVTGDFDESKTGDWCSKTAIKLVKPGNIIVMHDSERAFPRLKILLPELISFLTKNNYRTDIL